eukprot:230318-Prorocentrum_lima.AAC.1
MPESTRKLSHVLVHHDVMRPEDGARWDFGAYTLCFASNVIGKRVADKLTAHKAGALWQLVNTADAWRWMPTARGTLFEALVLKKLAEGNPMQMRCILE